MAIAAGVEFMSEDARERGFGPFFSLLFAVMRAVLPFYFLRRSYRRISQTRRSWPPRRSGA